MLKYLIDENLAPLYAEQLRRQRPDIVVRAVGEPGVPDKGTLDPDILNWCELNQFVLFTNNRASMPTHLKDSYCRGSSYSRHSDAQRKHDHRADN